MTELKKRETPLNNKTPLGRRQTPLKKINSGGSRKLFPKNFFWKIFLLFIISDMLVTPIIGRLIQKSRTHFKKGTYYLGVDISGLTLEKANEKLAKAIDGYTVTIKERGGKEEVLTAEQMGISYRENDSLAGILKEADKGKTINQPYTVWCDMGKLEKAIDALDCMQEASMTDPTDPYIEEKDGELVVVPGTEGTRINRSALQETLRSVVDVPDTDEVNGSAKATTLASDTLDYVLDLTKGGVYYVSSGSIKDAEDLEALAEKWNKVKDVELTCSFGDAQEAVRVGDVFDWDEDSVYANSNKVWALVSGWSKKYNTYGKPFDFKTHSGTMETVRAYGYGWELDIDATSDILFEEFQKGESKEVEPVFKHKAYGWENNGLSGSYIEVSIAEQKTWVYDNGKCVFEADVTTGAPTILQQTQTGCYALGETEKDASLSSIATQGNEGTVDYYIPFNGEQGFHDAPWRSDFGGDIYQTNGTHGCINMSTSDMAAFVKVTSKGMPVVIL